MGNFTYVAHDDDLVKDLAASAITILTEDTDYPETKIQTIPMADTARATDPGAGIKIRLDFGSNKNIAFWSILNHNIASGNPVVKTYNDAFSTPSGETKTMTYRALDVYVNSAWAAAKRYYEIDLSACTFNDAFFEWGRVIAALAATTFTAGFSPGIERGYGHENIINVTSFGVAHTHVKQAKINYLTVRWDPHIKASVLTELLAFLDKSYGGAYPSIIIPDSTAAEMYYMRCQDLVNWGESDARAILSRCELRFKQLSRGKVQEG